MQIHLGPYPFHLYFNSKMNIMSKEIPFKVGSIYNFYDDGKLSESRKSQMKVMEIVHDLKSLKTIVYSDAFSQTSAWDMWQRSIQSDLVSFNSISYKIFDWGCTDFIICSPIGENNEVDTEQDVIFARTDNGGWYTLEDPEWNGCLIAENIG